MQNLEPHSPAATRHSEVPNRTFYSALQNQKAAMMKADLTQAALARQIAVWQNLSTGGNMETERHVRLFKNGRSQAIRIPKDFELPGDEAIIRKEGACLIVKPVRRPSLLAILSTLEPLDEDFPDLDETLVKLDDIEL